MDKNSKASRTPEQELSARTRRAFLTMGIAGAAGFAGWRWILSRPEQGRLPGSFRGALQFNERLAKAFYDPARLAPVFPPGSLQDLRENGGKGMEDEIDQATWRLAVNNPSGEQPLVLTLDDIRALPRVEHRTQLKCVEGWSAVNHFAGARFSDFTAKFAPRGAEAPYVSMVTPDRKYFVGLDMPGALHPQTLLCYEMNGAPLLVEHGAPLRLAIPVKYGIKNIKRIGSITYTFQRPRDYWAEQGYDWYAGL